MGQSQSRRNQWTIADTCAFEEAIDRDDLVGAQSIWKRNSMNAGWSSNAYFSHAAIGGHLTIAQWIYGFGDVNVHRDHDDAFCCAAAYGHLAMVQWIYGLGGVDVHWDHDLAFRYATLGGHLAIAQWIYDLGDVDVHWCDDWAFYNAVWRGHLAMAQWIYGLGDVDVHWDHDKVFRNAAWHGHLAVTQWIYSLGGVDLDNLQLHPDNPRLCDAPANIQSWLKKLDTERLFEKGTHRCKHSLRADCIAVIMALNPQYTHVGNLMNMSDENLIDVLRTVVNDPCRLTVAAAFVPREAAVYAEAVCTIPCTTTLVHGGSSPIPSAPPVIRCDAHASTCPDVSHEAEKASAV